MPSLNLNSSHQLGQEEATNRLKTFFEKLKARHGDKVSNLKEEWQGNLLKYSFSTYGFNIKGDLSVEADAIKIKGELPFAAMMFKGKIEQAVKEELQRVLA